jgi:hypothetical protein
MHELGIIKETCLWYWDLKIVISQCPNIVHADLGNIASTYNVSVLMPGARSIQGAADDDNEPKDPSDLEENRAAGGFNEP